MEPNQVTQTGTQTVGFVHPLIQTLLLFILPMVMQGLKKITWIERNKAWVCPLLCIAAATLAAYLLSLPQWLMVGIITGAACNKIYDWSKDIGLRQSSAIMIILLLVFVVGCSQVTMSPEYQRTVKMAAVAVNELNARCQAGDPNACKEGLAEASKTLNLIVDAMQGRQ